MTALSAPKKMKVSQPMTTVGGIVENLAQGKGLPPQ
jgi:hypothetical protein